MSATSSEGTFSVFQPSGYVGSSWKEIEDATIFGPRLYPRAKRGKWNTRHRLEYSGGMKDENPYITEVGFFDNKEAAYFLIQKRSLEKGLQMNDAEILGQLYKVASAGTWERGDESNGIIYQYTLNKKKRVLMGFRTPNFRQLLIYSPKVSPNLDGMSSAPLSLLY